MATAVIAAVAALLAGVHGGISAALGGLASMVAGVVAGLLLQAGKARTAADMVVVAIVAEVVRIVVMLAFILLVLTTYKQVVPGGLIGAFIVTVLIFSMAILVRENKQRPS